MIILLQAVHHSMLSLLRVNALLWGIYQRKRHRHLWQYGQPTRWQWFDRSVMTTRCSAGAYILLCPISERRHSIGIVEMEYEVSTLLKYTMTVHCLASDYGDHIGK